MITPHLIMVPNVDDLIMVQALDLQPEEACAVPKLDNSKAISENQLWEEFKSGSKESFSAIFRRYYKPLSLYGLHLHPNNDLIKDCIQEFFLDLWLYRERLGQVDSVQFYLLKCFKRRVIRNIALQKKHQHVDLKSHYEWMLANSFEADLIKEQSESERKQSIIQELSHLPKRQQEAIYLKFSDSNGLCGGN